MKIDFDTVICDLDGKAIEIPASMKPGADGNLAMDTMTLKKVCTTALIQALDGDDKETNVSAMLDRDMLARRIHAGGSQSLSSEEIVILKDRLFKRWKIMPQLVTGALVLIEAKPLRAAA